MYLLPKEIRDQITKYLAESTLPARDALQIINALNALKVVEVKPDEKV